MTNPPIKAYQLIREFKGSNTQSGISRVHFFSVGRGFELRMKPFSCSRSIALPCFAV